MIEFREEFGQNQLVLTSNKDLALKWHSLNFMFYNYFFTKFNVKSDFLKAILLVFFT